jgi:hypothetical protein
VSGSEDRSGVRGMFANAVQQSEDAVRLRTVETAPRQRLNRAIKLIDSMLGMLERCNLIGSVPARGSLESGISALHHAIPAECEIRLGAVHAPEKLMDELFAVQQRLLAMRAGPDWAWAYADEEPEPPDRWVLQNGA